MGIISNTEDYFLATGKVRNYTDRVANNCETMNVVIPKNGLQKIFLEQSYFLDNKKIRAIEIVADDQIINSDISGRVAGVLESAALPVFTFTLSKDSDFIATTPLSCMHRPSNAGKFYFIDSEAGSHRIGDSFIEQINSLSANGVVIVLRFWYD